MHSTLRPSFFAATGLSLALLASGCATSSGSIHQIVHSRHASDASLGARIAIVMSADAAATALDKPTGRNAITDGATDNMRALLIGGAGSSEGAVVALALLPVAALIGAAGDLTNDTPPAALARAESGARTGLNRAAVQTRLRDAFAAVADQRAARRFHVPATPDVSALPAQGVDHAVELAVADVSLRRTGMTDDSFALVIRARAKWIRTTDGTVLREDEAEYLSPAAGFLSWSGRDGKNLERSADYGFQLVAERLLGSVGPAEPMIPATANIAAAFAQ